MLYNSHHYLAILRYSGSAERNRLSDPDVYQPGRYVDFKYPYKNTFKTINHKMI